jgi:hypothetical protein
MPPLLVLRCTTPPLVRVPFYCGGRRNREVSSIDFHVDLLSSALLFRAPA